MNGLTACQQAASKKIDSLIENKRGFIFITGEAGTGKSYLSSDSRERHRIIRIAPTGIAAILDPKGGETVHSFLSVKGDLVLESSPTSEHKFGDAAKMNMTREAAAALQCADAVLIDELPMTRVDLFDLMDIKFRKALSSREPFGGKPIIGVGDIWQLPPVVKEGIDQECINRWYEGNPYFWGSSVYRKMVSTDYPIHFAELTEVVRQSGDPVFRDILNRLRRGISMGVTPLNQRVERWDQKSLAITFTNREADNRNAFRLSLINGETRIFTGESYGQRFGSRELPVAESIALKIGARVMLRANNRQNGYVNGDLGEVVEFKTNSVMVLLDRTGEPVEVIPNKWDKQKYDYDEAEDRLSSESVGMFTQLPITHGWAITAHKSQGQTFDRAHLALDGRARPHALYVAVSRIRTLDGITLERPIAPSDISVNPQPKQWQDSLQKELAA